MADTYTQIYIHYVFATELRFRILHNELQTEFFNYSAGVVKDLNCFIQCIGGMEDHIHLLIGLHPTLAVSEFAQKFKANTSRFINEKHWVQGNFNWQKGFGAFSVSQSVLERVRDYIQNQEQHHRNLSFQHEYEALLEKNRIRYDQNYMFHEPNP